ncbi:MAG: outer membrane protein assembly factor BamB family protein [Thermogutta sp.]
MTETGTNRINPALLTVGVPAVAALLGMAALVYWLVGVPLPELKPRVPGMDRATQGPTGMTERERLTGTLIKGEGVPSRISGEWPWFRGVNLDAIWEDKTVSLAQSWDADGPPRLWSIAVGEGFAAAAIKDGRVYLIDYDREQEQDVVRCLSLDDGRDIWQFRYSNSVKRNHGMSRTIPAVTDKYVITIGPKCHVACLDRETGESRWLIDMTERWGATVPPWYAGQCPLVDQDRLILAPGGPEALLVALDLETGKELWRTPNPRNWKMTHSSVVPVEFRGRKTYVYCASGGVVGVDASVGTILWETAEWKISLATVPSPLPLPNDQIFFCGGYDAGALMLQLKNENEKIIPEKRFRLPPEKFGSTQQTPLFFNGYIYGVREKDKQLVCLDLEGNIQWASGSQYRFGLGPYMIANRLLLALDDDGTLTLAEATSEAFKPLARAKVLDGHDCWGPMALVKGRLIIRSLTEMICLDLTSP